MASSFPEPIELNTNANNNRLYLILGVFILLMIIIFSVFFKDNIRNLLLGNIDSVNLEDKIYNNLEITIFSDHDSRIAKDDFGSSVIFAEKLSKDSSFEINSEIVSSNEVFKKKYYYKDNNK